MLKSLVNRQIVLLSFFYQECQAIHNSHRGVLTVVQLSKVFRADHWRANMAGRQQYHRLLHRGDRDEKQRHILRGEKMMGRDPIIV